MGLGIPTEGSIWDIFVEIVDFMMYTTCISRLPKSRGLQQRIPGIGVSNLIAVLFRDNERLPSSVALTRAIPTPRSMSPRTLETSPYSSDTGTGSQHTARSRSDRGSRCRR